MNSASENPLPITLRGSADAPALTFNAELARDQPHLCLPAHIAQQLHLVERDRRAIKGLSVPYVGPIEVTYGNRTICCGAVVYGDAVRLGMVPLSDIESDAL